MDPTARLHVTVHNERYNFNIAADEYMVLIC
jgi:hypothetical protein